MQHLHLVALAFWPHMEQAVLLVALILCLFFLIARRGFSPCDHLNKRK